MEAVAQCPVCEGKLKTYLTTKDLFGTNESFDLLLCQNCHTLETSPQPDTKEIIKYYKSNSYVSHGDTKKDYSTMFTKSIQRLKLQI